jgi:MtN3 and saliva related transmembrane protein
MSLVKFCGIPAGICTTGALASQMYRLAKLRSAAEIAISFLAGNGVGLSWAYGLRHATLAFQVTQVAAALIVISIALLTVAYGGISPHAAILAPAALLPQVFRTARPSGAHKLSRIYLVTFSLGVTLWFIYGPALHAPPIYVPQVASGVLVAVTFVLEVRSTVPSRWQIARSDSAG